MEWRSKHSLQKEGITIYHHFARPPDKDETNRLIMLSAGFVGIALSLLLRLEHSYECYRCSAFSGGFLFASLLLFMLFMLLFLENMVDNARKANSKCEEW
ncbi:hypothetical protein Q1695_007489 [Nippostrongylus brasiliensis]|nr:hypothetical protein Q1695_007489 [Nippostrongylus brasiliensis]